MVLAARLRTRAVVGLSCRVRGRFGIDLVNRCEISAGSGELSSSQVYIYIYGKNATAATFSSVY
jgi:hypothetical protein